MIKFEKLKGKFVYLSPINIDDYKEYSDWVNDIDIAKYINQNIHLTYSQEKDALGVLTKKSKIFGIHNREAKKLIGNCSIFDIDYISGTAKAGIFIGDKNFWNQGYGTEAFSLLIDYGFNILNLENIMIEVFDYNERALKSYKKIGFKEIGRRRNAHKIAGKRYDIIFLDIIYKDFVSPFIKDIVESDEHEKKFGMKLEIL